MKDKFNKNKRILSALLAGVMLLGGCGSSDDTAANSQAAAGGNKIQLTLWHYYSGTTKVMLDAMITEFNETVGVEKNILVDAYSHSSVNELASNVVSSANKEVGAEDMPDIFAAYSDNALLLDSMGMVANMDPYFTAEELALFRADFLEEGRFDSEGNLKIIPVAKSTEILFINESDFSVFATANDISYDQLATWEGLADVAAIYYDWTDAQTEEPDDGQALFGIDSTANFMILAAKQAAEEIYDYSSDDITFGLSQQGARKVWDNYITPYVSGLYVSFGSFRSDDVKSGDLLMYVGSTSSAYYFPNTVELSRTESYDIVGTTLPYPYFEGGEKFVVQQGAGMVVSKSDADTEAAAAEFLKWFTAPENNLKFAVSTGYMPVQNLALDYATVNEVLDSINESGTPSAVASSADTVYNTVLPEFTFYANRPFDGSYNARNAISNNLINTLAEMCEQYDNLIADGLTRDEALEVLLTNDNFETWYQTLANEVGDALK